jgi:hypothetical protein
MDGLPKRKARKEGERSIVNLAGLRSRQKQKKNETLLVGNPVAFE